jgi:hypothetical protein
MGNTDTDTNVDGNPLIHASTKKFNNGKIHCSYWLLLLRWVARNMGDVARVLLLLVAFLLGHLGHQILPKTTKLRNLLP